MRFLHRNSERAEPDENSLSDGASILWSRLGVKEEIHAREGESNLYPLMRVSQGVKSTFDSFSILW